MDGLAWNGLDAVDLLPGHGLLWELKLELELRVR